MVTKQQALSAQEFHYGTCTRKVGPRGGVTVRIETWHRNGATQTWKTRPAEFRVPIKYGMRDYSYVDQHNAAEFHTAEDCPLRQEEPARPDSWDEAGDGTYDAEPQEVTE